jgi:hypothetical protein
MDYSTLSEITKTIITVLQNVVDPTNTVKVLPEILRNSDVGLGFYLFHVQESSHYKNFPAPGKDNPPVPYTPMALNLYYQLSANWRDGEQQDALEEQRLMTIGMKTLHDNPVILTSLPDGKDINIKLTLQILSPSESVQYWAAAESPVRLSAYYEVSVVFLEPEKPRRYAGRVLRYGNYVFTRREPHINASENMISFTVPAETSPRQVVASPAQCPPASALPAPDSSKVTFQGYGFGGDGTVSFRIINERWPETAIADPVAWEVAAVGDDQVVATIREQVQLQPSATIVDMVPGLYSAQIERSETISLPEIGPKIFHHRSNIFPFLVTPRIDSIAPASGGAATLFTVNGFVFQHPDLAANSVRVFIGEQQLNDQTGSAPGNGDFAITAPGSLQFQIPTGFSTGLTPVRVIINGVESTPNWITLT